MPSHGVVTPRAGVCAGLAFLALWATYGATGRAAEDELTRLRVGVDDANIYFRYARNIVNGHGCVWNPGGERVEGNTSPLWTTVCVAAFATSAAPERVLFWTNVTLAAAAAWLVARVLACVVDPRRGAAAWTISTIVVAAWIAGAPGHVAWMTATLMDTALFTLALVVAVAAADAFVVDARARGRRIAFGVALAALALARPEGMLHGAALGLSAGAVLARRRGVRDAILVLRAPATIALAAIVAVFAFRRAYFGFWLPNTYYAKVDSDLGFRLAEGAKYLAAFAAAHPFAVFAAAAGAAVGAWRAPSTTLGFALLATAAAGAAVLFVGGDHFGCWRAVQPVFLLLTVPIAAAVSGGFRAGGGRVAAFATVGLAVAAGNAASTPVRFGSLSASTDLYFFVAEHGRATGEAFNRIFPGPERPVVGVVGAGAFPFAYEGWSFDLLGLNDVTMAHASATRRGTLHGHGAFHAPTFFARPPDILVGLMKPAPVEPPTPPPERIPLVDLCASDAARFDATYAAAAVATPETYAASVMLPVWVRRAWLDANRTRYSAFLREIARSGDGYAYR